MNTNPFQRRPSTAYNFGQLALMHDFVLHRRCNNVDFKPKTQSPQRRSESQLQCHEVSLMSIDNHQSFFPSSLTTLRLHYFFYQSRCVDKIQVGEMSNDQVRIFFFIHTDKYSAITPFTRYPTLRRSYRSRPLQLVLQRYVRDDLFLYNRDCTYRLVHTFLSLSPHMLLLEWPILSVSAEPMEVQMVRILVFLGYRLFLLLRVVD